uniref:tRNA:m(4)X modification enzyme TRM13 n=1 Tax=Neospora caninum (strain Liverpool) TaxID=572307 RepID=A0A0F7U4P9_NEOCL|nr:TPA: Ubiquitin, related [Neospora caninum Liverpool]
MADVSGHGAEGAVAKEPAEYQGNVSNRRGESRTDWPNPLFPDARSAAGARPGALQESSCSVATSSSSSCSIKPAEGRDCAETSLGGSASYGRTREGAGASGEDSAACAPAQLDGRKGKKALARGSVSGGHEAVEGGENLEDRIPCPVDPRHSIYLGRVSAHVRKCTKIRDMAFAHLLPFVLPGCNCGETGEANGKAERAIDQASKREGSNSSVRFSGDDQPRKPGAGDGEPIETIVETVRSEGAAADTKPDTSSPSPRITVCISPSSSACLSPSPLPPLDIEELHKRVLRAVKQCCEELGLSLSLVLPPASDELAQDTEEVERHERYGWNPAAELLRAAAVSEQRATHERDDLTSTRAEKTGHTEHEGSVVSDTLGRKRGTDAEEERRASILMDCITRASKAAAQHRQRQRRGSVSDPAEPQNGEGSTEGMFPLAFSTSFLESLGLSPLAWLRKVMALMDKHDEQNAQLVAICALVGFLPTSRDALQSLLVVELGAGKAALTRWLATWTVAAFADAAKRRASATQASGGQPEEACVPGDEHPKKRERAAADDEISHEKVNPDVSLQTEERDRGKVVGVRFVVVEREARRNAKELKDEEMQSMSAKRIRSENHFKKRKHAGAMEAASSEGGERQDDQNGSREDPRFVRHVVRLRIDISDFDLRAMLRYMNLGDSRALRQPHIPSFFKLLHQHNCCLFPRRSAPIREPIDSDPTRLEGDVTQADGRNATKQASTNRNDDLSKDGELLPGVAPTRRRSPEKQENACTPQQAPTLRDQFCDSEASLDAYWELTKQLGFKGGADMKEMENCLESHFLNKPAERVLGVAKHLCGGGTDVALRCFVRCRKAFTEIKAMCPRQSTGDSGLQREAVAEAGPRRIVDPSEVSLCLCIAPCCHHRCDEQSFVGVEILRKLGFADEEFPRLAAATGWATGASGDKQRTGSLIKRLLDLCRLIWLRKEGFESATMRRFASSSCSPENFVILASAGS